jgi:hypothetical protein
MEAARSSKTMITYRITTRRHKPEDHDLNLHHRETLKSRVKIHEDELEFHQFLLEMANRTKHVRKMEHTIYTRVCRKVSGLAAWSENCKWYSSLPLGAITSLFCESV